MRMVKTRKQHLGELRSKGRVHMVNKEKKQGASVGDRG